MDVNEFDVSFRLTVCRFTPNVHLASRLIAKGLYVTFGYTQQKRIDAIVENVQSHSMSSRNY